MPKSWSFRVSIATRIFRHYIGAITILVGAISTHVGANSMTVGARLARSTRRARLFLKIPGRLPDTPT